MPQNYRPIPEVARMIAEFENDTTRSYQKDSEHHHHEQHPGVKATFVNDVPSLFAVVLEESENILVVDTRDITNVWETVRDVETTQPLSAPDVNAKFLDGAAIVRMLNLGTAKNVQRLCSHMCIFSVREKIGKGVRRQVHVPPTTVIPQNWTIIKHNYSGSWHNK